MLKFAILLAPLLILSGCSQVLGICTSVDVHTSIDGPGNVAQQELSSRTTSDSALGAQLAASSATACSVATR